MGARVLASLILSAGLFLSPPVLAQSAPATEPTPEQKAQTALHMLDYVSVDYGGAVENGRIKADSEYEEQLGFVKHIRETLKGLPANPNQGTLVAGADRLTQLVDAKAPLAEVAAAASKLKWDTIAAYGIRVTPRHTPDLKVAPALYQQYCVSCHGANGSGDGPAAASLDPPPANFHNAGRMPQRSLYGLYNTITLGVNGTAMAPHPELTDDDRWALAFYVGNFLATDTLRERGAVLWGSGAGKQDFPDIANVATLSQQEVTARYGADAATMQLYLRAHPDALAVDKPAPIDFAIETVTQAGAAYAAGDRANAQQLAAQAYLEGFDLVEKKLQGMDAALMTDTEREMGQLREKIRLAAPAAEVAAQIATVQGLLAQSRTALSGTQDSATTTYVSALVILLREGIEAILVIAAIVAFLVKTNRRDALPYVHAGWVLALLLGMATWAAATWLIDVSGSSREMTEGVTGLIAAAMLVYVGYWLHSKASAQAWQRFIKDQIGAALAKKTLWAMAFIAFFAVYREMFETVLFYQALWAEGGGARGPLLAGIASGAVLLGLVAWALFKYSIRLPLKPFFTVTSTLLCGLAVVMAGKAIYALQNAGKVGSSLVNVPEVPLLGVFPTVQGLVTQAVVVIAVILAFRYSTRAGNAA